MASQCLCLPGKCGSISTASLHHNTMCRHSWPSSIPHMCHGTQGHTSVRKLAYAKDSMARSALTLNPKPLTLSRKPFLFTWRYLHLETIITIPVLCASYLGYSLNSFRGDIQRIIQGSLIEVIEGDARTKGSLVEVIEGDAGR